MKDVSYEAMKRSMGFDDAHADNVRALVGPALPLVPKVVDHFYARLFEDSGARAVVSGGREQEERLRETLCDWLEQVFEGPYDDAYFERRRRIGTTHVRVGLPQHYMITGMHLVWEDMERRLREQDIPDIDRKLRSLHRLLLLDLAVMLGSYKDRYAKEVREFERSAVEEKLTRAEHLAEIGQLAASLAHEIKNPLAGISGAIQIIREAMAPDNPHQPIVVEILGQIGRLDATVKDLLNYARPTPPRATNVSLHQVIKRVLSVLREEPSLRGIRIEFEPPPTNTVIHADDAQIEQLLMNLLINAAHATGDKGVIRLGITRNAQEVGLTVEDNGTGMEPDVRDKAFEAFFTTKAKGTGLGLPICKRIVESHGGTIMLASEVGRGTRVVVTLPKGVSGPVEKVNP